MKVIKNFLVKEEFNNIKNIVTSNKFHYFFQNSIASDDDDDCFYFVHEFYVNHKPQSSYFDIILPILKKLKIYSLMRAKVNCFPRGQKLIKYGEHSDYDFSHKGAIFYINTCDGGTYIGDKFIPSIENQILLFDSSIPHQSTNCTDEKCRFNININYF